jgi:O-antigen/teichoic acid export membrane protein
MPTPQLPQPAHRALNSLGRFFKMDMHYFARGTAWSTLSQIATVFATISLSVVLSHHIPKEAYGEYKFVLSIVSILCIFSLASLGGAVMQSVSRGFDGSLAEGFKANIRWSFAVFVGALAVALYYFFNGNNTLAIGVLLGGCLSPFIASGSLTLAFLTAKKDFARLAIYGSIIGSCVPALALILTALVSKSSLVLVSVYFISNVLTDLFLYWYIVRIYRPDPRTSDPHMMSYAKHLSFMGVLGGVSSNLGQILLFHYVGPVQLALYAFAIGIPDQIKGPMKNLDGMLQVRFVNHENQNIRDNMRNKSLLLLAFALVCIGIYIPLAPYIYHLLFPAYMEAVPYSQVYILSLLGLPLSPAGSYLAAKKLIKEQYIANMSIQFLQIALMAVGVIYWGLWGLVWSIVAVRILSGFIWYILYRIASLRDIDKGIV